MDEKSPVSNWRQTKLVALAELAVVLLLFIADLYHFVPFSKTPFLFVLGWISLRMRKVGWKGVGLAPFRTWTTMLVVGLLCGVGLELFELFGSQPLLVRVTGKPPDLFLFRPLIGNVKLFVVGLALAWTLAAFGEELVYRGYLMNRLADLGNGTRTAWSLSLILISTLFGFAHFGQGLTGMVENGIDGLFLGLMYFATGRNLSVPIIAHGVSDTVDLALIFLGKYPTM